MSVVGFVRSYWWRVALWRLQTGLAKRPPAFSLERNNWARSIQEPTLFYFECLRFFYQQLPPELREHRAYFHNVPSNRRGFGENPFHVMWYLLFREFRPSNFLEIGVYRGQTISLAALAARCLASPCQVWGISPFTSAGDSVSKYAESLDYYQDTLKNFAHFNLPPAKLVRARSTEPEAVKTITSESWDMIYIDGNHDYEIARKDWDNCSANLKPGGVIVLDDSALHTAYAPPPYAASRGHPGPSQLAKEIDRANFTEILQVGHNRVFQKVV